MVYSSFEDRIKALKAKPLEDELKEILKTLAAELPADRTDNLTMVLVLLSITVPEVYEHVGEIRSYIAVCCRSIIGIGNLLARIGLAKSAEDEVLLHSLVDLLQRICKSGVISTLVSSSTSRLETTEIDRYFFKGKIFLITAELELRFVENTLFSTIDAYAAFLTGQLQNVMSSNMTLALSFIQSAFSFHTKFCGHFFNMLLTTEHWHFFHTIALSLKVYFKRRFLEKFWCTYLPEILISSTSSQKLNALAHILSTAEMIDSILAEDIVEAVHLPLCQVAAYCLTKHDEQTRLSVVHSQLKRWGNESNIKMESIALQRIRTILIILVLKCTPNECSKLLKEPVFINAISVRLGSFSDTAKNLAILMANSVCEFSGQDLIFNDTETEEITAQQLTPEYTEMSDAWKDFALSVEEINSVAATEVEKSVSKLTIDQDSDDDSDYTSDDDDPTIKKKIVSKPLYIKDLLAYINVDREDPAAYEKRKSALEYGPTLIRQKLKFGSEVRAHTSDLLTSILAMQNIFEESTFEQNRLNCLIAAASSDINLGSLLVEMLAGGDYSLQQRTVLLSAIAFAARELRGIEDEMVKSSFIEKTFPTELLPKELHQKLVGPQDFGDMPQLGSAYKSLEDDLMHDASEKAHDEINGGKILRISKRILKSKTSNQAKPKDSNFHKIIGPKFFFPLVNLWHQVDGINIGHYSPLLISHYLRTLGLILHAAYPIAVDFKDMVREMLIIIASTFPQVQLDHLPLVESLFTSILLVLDTSDPELLVVTFPNELSVIEMWASTVWEQIIDERVKSLGAGVVLRLHEISKNYERTLMAQLNSTI